MTNQRITPIRRLIGDILILLIVLFTIYLCVIMLKRINAVVLKATYKKIFFNELILCGILLLSALDVRFGFFTGLRPAALQVVGWGLRILVAVLSLGIVFLCGKVVVGGLINTTGEAKDAIVLGMALQNGKPTQDLIFRLDTAQRYLEDHPTSMLILTGGNPDETGMTEAGIMRKLLLERHVNEAHLILEDEASSTRENFENSARLIDPQSPVVLITSDYHMDRSLKMARDAGFSSILRLPAPSDWRQYGANVMWEVILDINEIVNGR